MKAPVSAMLMLLARDLKGRVKRGVLVDTVFRGALLADLALSRRVSNEDAEISIDETPTGYRPADELAAAMLAQPGRPLIEWLTAREPVQDELVAYWLAQERWQQARGRRQPRYTDRLESQVAPLRWRLRHIINDDAEGDTTETCVAVLAELTGLLDQAANAVDPETLARCGDAAWLMPMINDWATARIARQRDIAAAAAVSGSPGG